MNVDRSKTQRSANNLFLLIIHSSNGEIVIGTFPRNVTPRHRHYSARDIFLIIITTSFFRIYAPNPTSVNICFALRTLVANIGNVPTGTADYQEAISQEVLAGSLGSRSRFAGETRRRHFNARCQTRGASAHAKYRERDLAGGIPDVLVFWRKSLSLCRTTGK
jgi:hypothetical protein